MGSFYKRISHIFTVLIYIYGIWYGFVNNYSSSQVLGIIPAAILYGLVYFIKLPKPSQEQLEKIVGKDPADEANDNVAMKTIAHRGCGLDAPENTIAAFKLCEMKGCNFIEFDVRLTKDEVPIVFHDHSLERMANSDKIIDQSTWNEIKDVDISVNHALGDRFTGTNIATLDDVVQQILAGSQNMIIDLKEYNTKICPVIIELFKKYPELEARAIVSTFFPYLIYLIRKKNKNIVCSVAYRPYYFTYDSYTYAGGYGRKRATSFHQHCMNHVVNTLHTWTLPRFTYYICGISMILLHKDCTSPQIIENWREKGIRVCVWTVNHPLEKQYFYNTLKCTYLTDTLVGESSTHFDRKNK